MSSCLLESDKQPPNLAVTREARASELARPESSSDDSDGESENLLASSTKSTVKEGQPPAEQSSNINALPPQAGLPLPPPPPDISLLSQSDNPISSSQPATRRIHVGLLPARPVKGSVWDSEAASDLRNTFDVESFLKEFRQVEGNRRNGQSNGIGKRQKPTTATSRFLDAETLRIFSIGFSASKTFTPSQFAKALLTMDRTVLSEDRISKLSQCQLPESSREKLLAHVDEPGETVPLLLSEKYAMVMARSTFYKSRLEILQLVDNYEATFESLRNNISQSIDACKGIRQSRGVVWLLQILWKATVELDRINPSANVKGFSIADLHRFGEMHGNSGGTTALSEIVGQFGDVEDDIRDAADIFETFSAVCGNSRHALESERATFDGLVKKLDTTSELIKEETFEADDCFPRVVRQTRQRLHDRLKILLYLEKKNSQAMMQVLRYFAESEDLERVESISIAMAKTAVQIRVILSNWAVGRGRRNKATSPIPVPTPLRKWTSVNSLASNTNRPLNEDTDCGASGPSGKGFVRQKSESTELRRRAISAGPPTLPKSVRRRKVPQDDSETEIDGDCNEKLQFKMSI